MLRSLPRWALASVATPPRALLVLAAYLAAHALARFLMPPSLGYDDAEQALFAQTWSLGYRFQQPPLVTWLVLALRDGLGLETGLASLVLLRSLLLAVLHVTFYLAARQWLGDHLRAALASLALATIYTLGYLAHGDLLVSTALAAAVAASLWLWGRLLARPSLGRCLAFGVSCGVGLLAKWNFVMLAAAYLLVALLDARWRPWVLSWRTPLIAATTAAIAGPTALWVLANHPSFAGLTQEVLVEPAAGRNAVGGVGHLLTAALAFPQPMLALLLLAAWPALGRVPASVRPVALVMLVSLGLHGLLVPLAGAVNFPERWMITVELPLAILVLAAVPAGHPRLGVVAAVLLATVIGAWGVRLGVGLTDAGYCGKCRTRLPIAAFAEGLRGLGLAGGTVVALDMHLGGNLRLALPEARVVHPGYPPSIWPPATAPGCVLAWRPTAADLTPETGVHLLEAPLLGAPARRQAMAVRAARPNEPCP